MKRAPYRTMIWALAVLVALGSRLAAQTVEERGPQEAPKPAEGAPAKADSASEEPKPGKISGYIFGDYYYFPSHHDAKFDGQNGFWFRRVYLTYLSVVGSAIGFILHRDPDTYRYIPESIRNYPGAAGVAALLRDAGFHDARALPLLGGLMTIHTARR